MSLADLAYIRPEATFVPVLCGWKKCEIAYLVDPAYYETSLRFDCGIARVNF